MAKTVKASTQEHLDIEDILDDMVVYKTGWVGLVLSTTSVNFDLLSETEQDSTIYAYGAFLNSLTFPVQIMIRSKKADITAYFGHLAEAEASQTNPDIKKQIEKYRDFLQSIIQQKTVLDKSFYLIVNYNPLEKGLKAIGLGSPSKTKSKMQLLSDAKISLNPKKDHITKQMGRLGLTVKQLTTKDLIELFYDIYNPAPTGTQRIILDSASYTVPIVEPSVEVPTPAPLPINQESAPAQNFQPFQQIPLPQTGLQASPQTEGLRPVPPKDPAIQQSPAPEPVSSPATSQVQEENINMPPQTPVQINPVTQQVPPPPPTTQGSMDKTQLDALRSLQEATAKAAQIVNQTTIANPQQPIMPNTVQK